MKPELIKELFGDSDKAKEFFKIVEPYTGKHFKAHQIVHTINPVEEKK